MDHFLGVLESGKYRKGEHRLHAADDSMCCLGVATAEIGPTCGVKLLDQIKREDGSYATARTYEDIDGRRYSLLMPPVITEALGIPGEFTDSSSSGDTILVDVVKEDEGKSYEDDYVRGLRRMVAVSTLNDQGWSHPDIARRIRETLSVKEA